MPSALPNLNHCLICALLTFWLPPAIAAQPSAEISLQVQPNICISPRGQAHCISTLLVTWQARDADHFCLHSDFLTRTRLGCWQEASEGRFKHHVLLNSRLNYWITRHGDERPLANAQVQLALLKPHRKQPARRSRLPWSL